MASKLEAYLLTIHLDELSRWPFMVFFQAPPTMIDALPHMEVHPLPYAAAADTRAKAIRLLSKYGLPEFDGRFPASQVVFRDDGVEVGYAEIRAVPIVGNSRPVA